MTASRVTTSPHYILIDWSVRVSVASCARDVLMLRSCTCLMQKWLVFRVELVCRAAALHSFWAAWTVNYKVRIIVFLFWAAFRRFYGFPQGKRQNFCMKESVSVFIGANCLVMIYSLALYNKNSAYAKYTN